jgi:ankyrin repeat protein
MIAKCCIYYLRLKEFESFDSASIDLESMKAQHPFLAYAAYYWTQHYDEYDKNPLFDEALAICKPKSTHFETWRRILDSCATEQGTNKSSSMYDWSPLMIVARFGFDVMTTRLLEEGENPGEKTSYTRQMALHIAAEYGQSLVVKILLDAKSIPCLSNEDISLALSYACEGGNSNAVALLLSRRPDVNTRTRGATPLHYAVQEEHVEVVRLLLENSGIDIDAVVGFWGTSLQIAAYKNFTEIAKLLLENGANPNLNRRDDDGSLRGVPMALAASAGNLGMISLLNKHKADVNGSVGEGKDWLADSSRNFRCDSPLMMAASEQKVYTMNLLLQLGADLRRKVFTFSGHFSTSGCQSLLNKASLTTVFVGSPARRYV